MVQLSWLGVLRKVEGHRFGSWSGPMPGLQVWSPAGVRTGSNRSMFLSHTDVSLPLFLSPSHLSKKKGGEGRKEEGRRSVMALCPPPTPSPQQPLTLSGSVFWNCHVNEIIHYLPTCVWLLSLRTMTLGFTCVVSAVPFYSKRRTFAQTDPSLLIHLELISSGLFMTEVL